MPWLTRYKKTQGKLLYFEFKYKGSSFKKKIICKIKTDHKGQESIRGQWLVCMPCKELYAHTYIIQSLRIWAKFGHDKNQLELKIDPSTSDHNKATTNKLST